MRASSISRELTSSEVGRACPYCRVPFKQAAVVAECSAFLEAVRAAGVEISALAIPQCCISAPVASVVRDAGAMQVMVAAASDENAMFEALDRALRS